MEQKQTKIDEVMKKEVTQEPAAKVEQQPMSNLVVKSPQKTED